MLFSSLSSVLGGLGFAAYAGANHVLDASAERHALSGGSAWTSVNWDAWNLESPDPSDIGGAAVFLSSGAADYVQGHILAVDGGWLAR